LYKEITKIMRYCPYCKKEAPTKMTGGQIACAVILYLTFIIPGFFYSAFHARKCSFCGARTQSRPK
jgi:hypothetical protein